MVGGWWRMKKEQRSERAMRAGERARGRPTRATPANYLKTHPPTPYRSLNWLLYYAGGLKLDLSYIQYTAELVWDLFR